MIEIYVDPAAGQTVAGALSALPEQGRAAVRLAPGIYRENVSITRPDTVLIGAGQGKTVITGCLGAREPFGDGTTRGTFRTQTVFIHAHDVTVKDLTIENTAGPGRDAGQAIALYADGDRLLFDHVTLRGWQDTLFTGPLPPKEIEKGGFRGPLEFAPRINGRQRYVDCRIEGTVDFIFGSATALFDRCTLFSRDEYPGGNPEKIRGFVTAPSTPEGQSLGYIFRDCDFTGECPEGTCYLGRPWRDYAKAYLFDCRMGAHIRPEGWDDWGKENAHTTSVFAEHGSRYAGGESDPPDGLRRRLDEQEAARILAEVDAFYADWVEP